MTALAAVVIGRNEGSRLISCLDSLIGRIETIIYVDSGSTDGSRQAAIDRGVTVVELEMTQPFTAARARNAGIDFIRNTTLTPQMVQFLDGDCILDADWPEKAVAFLNTHPEVSTVCGRRRERFPTASIWNQMIDDEWDTPIGRTLACGGDALMRFEALQEVRGYNPTVIAGEEPELCVRLRQAGWQIWRIDAEMTLHDADMTRFSQWWQRAKRAGHAFAEGAALHGSPPENHYVNERRRAILWGLVLPLVTVLSIQVTFWALFLFLFWPLQMLRLRLKGHSRLNAIFLTLSKLPEGQGILRYFWRRWRQKEAILIEYK